jgi:dephospho-CoA kinase
MQIWGITALTGCGRKTAAAYLSTKGFGVLDIDDLSRRLIDRNTEFGKEGFEKIYKLLGNSVLNSLGDLDRSKLIKRLATNPADKLEIEKAIDPLVLKAVEKQRIDWDSKGIQLGFVHGQRLIEAGFPKIVRGMIRVSAAYALRVKRVIKRDTMGKEEVELMFQLQDQQTFIERNTQVNWKNEGKLSDLHKQIDAWTQDAVLAKK